MAIHDRAFQGGTLLADESRRHRPRSHRGLAPDQEAVLDLQRQAGNEAVARALSARTAGDVTSVDALTIEREGMAPSEGVQQIRSHTENKVTFALTVRTIKDNPPIMRPAPPEPVGKGYKVKAQPVDSIPEPDIHEYWPKDGVHKLSEGSYVDVSTDWEKTLEKGEDRHRDDAKLAWEVTWKKVQGIINELAKKDPPAEGSIKEAEQALWDRYRAALPDDLRPDSATPSIAKQRDVLQVEPGNIMAWIWETTVARDQRDNHSLRNGAVPEHPRPAPEKNAFVGAPEPHPNFLVPGPTAEELIPEVRKNFKPGKKIQGSKLKSGESDVKH